MRRSRQVLLACALFVGLALFFFAPVFYWFTTPNAPPLSVPTPIFRSAGCGIIGYGVLLGPDGYGQWFARTNFFFQLGCELPTTHGIL